MSWQFEHLIGPPQTAVGTSSNKTPISNSDTVQINNDSVSNPKLLIGKQYSVRAHANQDSSHATTATITTVTPSTTTTTTASESKARQQQDQEFFRRLLQSHESSNMEQSVEHNIDQDQLQQHQFGQQTNKSVSTATNISNTILTLSSSSLIDQLLPPTDQTPMPWSTTYSMPIYSSFGIDVNCSSDNSLIGTGGGQSSPAFQNALSFGNDSSKFLSIGCRNIIDRFSDQSSSSDNNNIFLANLGSATSGHARASNYQPQHRQDDSIASSRSYSSVLHSQAGLLPIQHGRISMFDAHQQTNNSDSLPGLNSQSSLVQTNVRQSPSSSTTSSQYRNPQARHLGEYSSNTIRQPYHLATTQYHQTSNLSKTAFIGAGSAIGQHQPGSDHGPSSLINSAGQFSRVSSDKSFHSASAINGPKRRNKLPFFTGNQVSDDQHQLKLNLYGSPLINSDGSERFSRKVFVGGLPPDIDEEEIKASFRRFGSLIVDWPHKAESKSYFPPKGYAFLLFHEESSVQALIDACLQEDDKLYLCVSSPTIKDKPVQIRPWRLSDADFVLDSTLALDPRKTVFVGGVPRPLKASELANIMNNLYGGVCYAGIDTDPELKYPKGAGRVAFSNHQSYIAAISARFVHLHHSEIEKRVEVKPYVLDDQFCDECQGARCGNKFAPFFCANITCLRYYCDNCWSTIHSQPGREFHKPLVKEGADRPRGVPFRWS